jgi:hypothetical protein
MEPKTREVPGSALRLSLDPSQLAIGDVRDEDGVFEADFDMLVRSKGAVESFFFGEMQYHDLSGMTHNDTILIDWNHSDEVIIGVGSSFEERDDGMHVIGKIQSLEEGDKAMTVIKQLQAGYPLEASIDFRPQRPGAIMIEDVDAGASAEVNGIEVHGPAMIFRKWPLTRAAVTPTGADGDYSALCLPHRRGRGRW